MAFAADRAEIDAPAGAVKSARTSGEDVRADYPDLAADDIRAYVAYTHAVIANDSLDAIRVTHK